MDNEILKRWCYLPREFHEAIVATGERLKAGASEDDPALPIFQYAAMEAIERERQKFVAGDRMALFAAIRQCANHDLVMPQWVSAAFIQGYDKVLNCHIGSWDEAFGRPYKKGAHIATLRKRRRLRWQVGRYIRDLLDQEHAITGKRPAIDNELFERVAAALNTNRDTVAKLYKATKNLYPENQSG